MRRLNVVLGPQSAAHRVVAPEPPEPSEAEPDANLAKGFQPQPAWNLKDIGGKTISDLTFVNRYMGGAAAWQLSDTQNIDRALHAAMTDAELQKVMAQYFNEPISSAMLPSAVKRDAAVGATVYKNTAEKLAAQMHAEGALDGADPASSIINVMLPEGVVLSDDIPMDKPPKGHEAKNTSAGAKARSSSIPTTRPTPRTDSAATTAASTWKAASRSTTRWACTPRATTASRRSTNSWKNVVATFYHELNEARTDADVEDVNADNDDNLLGWYSEAGQGEIGDLPINACRATSGWCSRRCRWPTARARRCRSRSCGRTPPAGPR